MNYMATDYAHHSEFPTNFINITSLLQSCNMVAIYQTVIPLHLTIIEVAKFIDKIKNHQQDNYFSIC